MHIGNVQYSSAKDGPFLAMDYGCQKILCTESHGIDCMFGQKNTLHREPWHSLYEVLSSTEPDRMPLHKPVDLKEEGLGSFMQRKNPRELRTLPEDKTQWSKVKKELIAAVGCIDTTAATE